MKLSFLLLIIPLLQVSAITHAQSITLNKSNVSLVEIFKDIRKQTTYDFLYSSKQLTNAKKVNINVKDGSITEVLDKCFKDQPFTYSVQNRTIIIKEKTSSLPGRVMHFFNIDLHGHVADDKGKPIVGAIIKVKGTTTVVLTNEQGNFIITAKQPTGILLISYLGYKSEEISFNSADTGPFNVVLQENQNALKEVTVVSTGYQNIPKERATGSFVQIDNDLLNRSVSTNILDRLNGVTSGLIFNNNGNHQFGQSNIEIRGRATLFSNAAPLIVIDNFPYDGDLNNINPNDIESITILKDAAAASAWGSRSGNGVIIITTKKGDLNNIPKVSFNTNITVGEKPDLYYTPQLSSSDYISVEQFLFNQGVYNNKINDGYSPLSPAVEVFLAKRNNTISTADSLSSINTLKNYDAREQLLKYFYRPSVNQQYQVGISGGSATQKYFVSAGFDKNLGNAVNNSYDRITLNASNTYFFLNNKLEFFSNIIYTGSKSKTGPAIASSYPYDQLADSNDNPLVVANNLRPAYATDAGNGRLLNWLYKPLEDLNKGYNNNMISLTDYRINLSLGYRIIKGLKATAYYNYEKGVNESNTLNELQSFYTRNLINTYSQINDATGTVTHPIPLGSILNSSVTDIQSHNGRFQLDYDNSWGKHAINALAGTEIRDYTDFSNTSTLYGYNEETASNQNSAVNYTADNPFFYGFNADRIPTNTSGLGSTNRFFSYYFNGAYVYDSKYIVSVSVRKDESNLFGVRTNQKGVPLWSAGLAMVVSNEEFYNVHWLPQLKLRATYGYTGNVNNSLSAYLTAQVLDNIQLYNVYNTEIINPPNPSLRWEKISNLNLGLDFGTKNNRLTGSIDFWRKAGMDLIGNSPIAPQTGIKLYKGNSASTLTQGLDIQLNSINLNGKFKWYTTLLYNYSQSKVTEYKVSNGSNYNIVSANYNNPLQGYPYYSVFSFKYGGLNASGAPQGYIDHIISTDYTSISNSTNRNEIVYNGSAVPTSFGSFRNTFSYKSFDLSFNVTYKFGYYFRRNSLNNSAIYSGGGNNYQMPDYSNRWQKPGDELTTSVPALIYPNDLSRNALYTYSDVLIEKGDHIRLQDFRIGFNMKKKPYSPFSNLNLFAYMNNVGMLWSANTYHIDPDYPTGIPAVRTIAFGLKADL